MPQISFDTCVEYRELLGVVGWQRRLCAIKLSRKIDFHQELRIDGAAEDGRWLDRGYVDRTYRWYVCPR
jgi:hypothetical protein